MGVIKNTFIFYLIIYSLVSVFSLLICLEDINHFEVVCPRLGHNIKQDLLELFLPLRIPLLDQLQSILMDLNWKLLSILIFSGLMVIILQLLYLFYYLLTKTPLVVQAMLNKALKVVAVVGLIIWIMLYFSGLGLNRIVEISGKLYQDPESYSFYVESMQHAYEQRRQQFDEYFE